MPTVNTENPSAIIVPNFGAGRYSHAMGQIWEKCQKLFGFSSAVSEMIARQAASDAGNILKSAPASFSVGKVNTDGKCDISDATKVKGAIVTNALLVVRAITWLSDAGKNGVSYGNTTWRVSAPLVPYIEKLEIECGEREPAPETPETKE